MCDGLYFFSAAATFALDSLCASVCVWMDLMADYEKSVEGALIDCSRGSEGHLREVFVE